MNLSIDKTFIPFQVHPEWEIFNFFIGRMQNVFRVDALAKTHPMTYYVESPQAIDNLFGRIAYDKCKYIGKLINF